MDDLADSRLRVPWLHLASVGAVLSTAFGEVLALRSGDQVKVEDSDA